MSESKSGGKNPLSGVIGLVVVVAVWTGINHWRQSSSIESQCNDQNLGAEYCSCFKGEMMSDLGILSSVPFVGRIVKSDEKWDSAQDKAYMACTAPNA